MPDALFVPVMPELSPRPGRSQESFLGGQSVPLAHSLNTPNCRRIYLSRSLRVDQQSLKETRPLRRSTAKLHERLQASAAGPNTPGRLRHSSYLRNHSKPTCLFGEGRPYVHRQLSVYRSVLVGGCDTGMLWCCENHVADTHLLQWGCCYHAGLVVMKAATKGD
jgi:hypothetical protein